MVTRNQPAAIALSTGSFRHFPSIWTLRWPSNSEFHRETVYNELLNRCPERTRDPLNGHSLAPKQLNNIRQPGGYEVPAGTASCRAEVKRSNTGIRIDR